MRIVFLDFDGVLNTRAFVEGAPADTRPGLDLLAQEAVVRVEALCVAARAAIVVSSTWRLSFEVPELERMLRARGLATTRVLGATPMIPYKRGRGQELQAWLDHAAGEPRWSLEGMVILDDDPDMLHLMPWLVQTSFETGLTDAHVQAARGILAGPTPALTHPRK